MSVEEVFVQQFAKLFLHYSDALTLEPGGEQENDLNRLNEVPAVELDRMISAARLAVLEIENDARAEDGSRQYYCKLGQAPLDFHGVQPESGLQEWTES
jgi:hypothetical protein